MRFRPALYLGLLFAGIGCAREPVPMPPPHASPPPAPVPTATAQTQRLAPLGDVEDPEHYKVAADKVDLYAQHHLGETEPCGAGCRYATHGHSHMSLRLSKHGVASLVDHGERLEAFQSEVGTNERHTAWHRRWSGSWTEGEGIVSIDLESAAVSCTRTATDGAQDRPCAPLKLHLKCVQADIRLVKPKRDAEPSWVCDVKRRHRRATAKAEATLTPLPWVFGLGRNVLAIDRTRGTHMHRRYAIGDVTTLPRARRR